MTNDSEEKKTQTTPKVFYKQASAPSEERSNRPRSTHGRNERNDRNRNRQEGSDRRNSKAPYGQSEQAPRDRNARNERSDRPNRKGNGSKENRFASRIESFKPSDQRAKSASPWQNTPAKVNRQRDTSDRSAPRHFNKDELYVYGENSCKAVARFRPEAIIKVFITDAMLKRFSELLATLSQSQIGYDIVESAVIERLTQTPHHGGVAFIIKRRQALSVAEYLSDEGYAKTDTVLAIDDIANPHNLGGIARTASFFNINGLLVRQPEVAENSAAIRVSEGGMESMTLIKADDFIADLMRLKKEGYKIIAVLPVKTMSIRSIALEKAKFERTKTVFVFFQQINEKVTDIADDIISVQGSSVMPALNISVLTGIVLATWQNRMH